MKGILFLIDFPDAMDDKNRLPEATGGDEAENQRFSQCLANETSM
jgi:hypothetical protein